MTSAAGGRPDDRLRAVPVRVPRRASARWLGLIGPVLLVGCGGRGPGADATADRARAEAINLVIGDMPAGFRSGSPVPPSRASAAQLAHCAGRPASDHADAVEVASPTFTAAVGQAQEQFSSEVTMLRTTDQAESELVALKRTSTANCLGRQLATELRPLLPPGSALGEVSVSRFSPPGSFLPAVGLRVVLPVTATVSGATARAVVTADLVEFSVGRSLVSLAARSTGSADLAGEESRLTALLERRAGGIQR